MLRLMGKGGLGISRSLELFEFNYCADLFYTPVLYIYQVWDKVYGTKKISWKLIQPYSKLCADRRQSQLAVIHIWLARYTYRPQCRLGNFIQNPSNQHPYLRMTTLKFAATSSWLGLSLLRSLQINLTTLHTSDFRFHCFYCTLDFIIFVFYLNRISLYIFLQTIIDLVFPNFCIFLTAHFPAEKVTVKAFHIHKTIKFYLCYDAL